MSNEGRKGTGAYAGMVWDGQRCLLLIVGAGMIVAGIVRARRS